MKLIIIFQFYTSTWKKGALKDTPKGNLMQKDIAGARAIPVLSSIKSSWNNSKFSSVGRGVASFFVCVRLKKTHFCLFEYLRRRLQGNVN